MNSAPNQTTVEFVDNLLAIARKVAVLLEATKIYLENGDLRPTPETSSNGEESHDDSLESVMKDREEEPPVEVVPEVVVQPVAEDAFEAYAAYRKKLAESFPLETVVVEKKRRAPVLHRARVTDRMEEGIIDALANRSPKPTMQEVAEEFKCSQSTVSRIWKNRLAMMKVGSPADME